MTQPHAGHRVADIPGNGMMEATSPPAGGGAERPSVGVLFVHGIGVQRRGYTLAEFGGPLVEWFSDWYDGLHGEWIHRGRVGFKDLERWLADLVGAEIPVRGHAACWYSWRMPPS